MAHAGFFTETYLINLPSKVASIRTSRCAPLRRYSGAHRPTLTHNRRNTQTRLSALPPKFRSSSLVRVRWPRSKSQNGIGYSVGGPQMFRSGVVEDLKLTSPSPSKSCPVRGVVGWKRRHSLHVPLGTFFAFSFLFTTGYGHGRKRATSRRLARPLIQCSGRVPATSLAKGPQSP